LIDSQILTNVYVFTSYTLPYILRNYWRGKTHSLHSIVLEIVQAWFPVCYEADSVPAN